MRVSLDTLKVLAESGCKQASEAISDWKEVVSPDEMEYHYSSLLNDFYIYFAYDRSTVLKTEPVRKSTIIGIPIIKVG